MRENNELSNLELQGNQEAHIDNSHLIGKRNPHGQIIANEPIFSELKFRLFNKNTKTIRIYSLATLIGTTFRKGQFEFRGRFTSLKDKNGVEIYEGDIVRMLDDWIDHYELYSNHQVEFGSGAFRLENGIPLYDTLDEDCDFEKCNFEVIGNIYENPELLKEV